MNAIIYWSSRNFSSGGSSITIGGSRIPADGRIYVIPFTFIWYNTNGTDNQGVEFRVQGRIVGTSTNYNDFEYVGAGGTSGFSVVANQVSGTQGLQGVQGVQGVQGIQGIAVQGLQGLQGEIGVQGLQGTQSLQGIQGIIGEIGLQGLQGTQGIQGFSNYPTDTPITLSAYNTTTQAFSVVGPNVLIFNTTSVSPYFSVTLSQISFNKVGWYKISVVVTIENVSASTANVFLWILGAGSVSIGTTNQIEVAPNQYDTLVLEEIMYVASPNFNIDFRVETNVAINSFAFGSASNYPSGGANKINIEMVSRATDPCAYSKFEWIGGYFNLTNGIDNQIPFDNISALGQQGYLKASNFGNSNASIEFLRTGVFMIDTFAHLFDMGTGMTLTSSLYTSTNGTTWTFLTFPARRQYTGANTNQIQIGKYLLRVTSIPFYIQMRLNPTANSPFPANLGAPTNFQVTRIGDI